MKPEGNIEKLPKWAQRYITKLERDLAYERKRLLGAQGGQASTVRLDPYADPPIGLGDDPLIEFSMAGDPSGRNYIQVKRGYDQPDALEVRGYDSLVVQPRSSNSLEIFPRRLGR